MSDAVEEDAHGWSLIRERRRIEEIQLDFRFGLILDDGTVIVIEGPFDATIDGDVTRVIPETHEHVGPPLAFLHRDVSTVRALRSGALHTMLADGARIDVAPGDGSVVRLPVATAVQSA